MQMHNTYLSNVTTCITQMEGVRVLTDVTLLPEFNALQAVLTVAVSLDNEFEV